MDLGWYIQRKCLFASSRHTKEQYQPWITLRLWPEFFVKENKPSKSERIVHLLDILRGFYYFFYEQKNKHICLLRPLQKGSFSHTYPSQWGAVSLRVLSVGKCFVTFQTCLGVKPDIRTPSGYYSCKGWFSICIEEVQKELYSTLQLSLRMSLCSLIDL